MKQPTTITSIDLTRMFMHQLEKMNQKTGVIFYQLLSLYSLLHVPQ